MHKKPFVTLGNKFPKSRKSAQQQKTTGRHVLTRNNEMKKVQSTQIEMRLKTKEIHREFKS